MIFKRLGQNRCRTLSLTVSALSTMLLASAALGDQVTLVGGDVLNGTIVERNDRSLIFDHPIFGRMVIPNDQIASTMTSVEMEAAQEEMAEDAPPSEKGAEGGEEEPPAEEDKPEPEWKSRFTFAGSGSFGNTDSQALTAKITSVRETEEMITSFDAAYFYGARDGDRNENRFTTGLRNDWLFPESRWFLFADARYDYDEFQSWDHRVSAHVGPGYELIKEDDLSLKVRAGIGAIKEWGSDNDDIRPEALVGADFSWQISKNQKFVASSTVYPDLDETGEFRAVNTAEWNAILNEERNLSLVAGLLHEYQSQVDDDIDKNDLKVFVGLGFDF